MTVNKDFLEIEKLREEIETELARRHNWAEQEGFWRNEAKLNRARVWIAIAAVAGTFSGVIVALFMFALNLTRTMT